MTRIAVTGSIVALCAVLASPLPLLVFVPFAMAARALVTA